ncbi:hypothetical protein HanRHA438_Chr04g0178981 [Helianthus annuus]|nr:hypothetical protein HanRHA438_Chr04g0178981 [Helianthus annuus]
MSEEEAPVQKGLSLVGSNHWVGPTPTEIEGDEMFFTGSLREKKFQPQLQIFRFVLFR